MNKQVSVSKASEVSRTVTEFSTSQQNGDCSGSRSNGQRHHQMPSKQNSSMTFNGGAQSNSDVSNMGGGPKTRGKVLQLKKLSSQKFVGTGSSGSETPHLKFKKSASTMPRKISFVMKPSFAEEGNQMTTRKRDAKAQLKDTDKVAAVTTQLKKTLSSRSK